MTTRCQRELPAITTWHKEKPQKLCMSPSVSSNKQLTRTRASSALLANITQQQPFGVPLVRYQLTNVTLADRRLLEKRVRSGIIFFQLTVVRFALNMHLVFQVQIEVVDVYIFSLSAGVLRQVLSYLKTCVFAVSVWSIKKFPLIHIFSPGSIAQISLRTLESYS